MPRRAFRSSRPVRERQGPSFSDLVGWAVFVLVLALVLFWVLPRRGVSFSDEGWYLLAAQNAARDLSLDPFIPQAPFYLMNALFMRLGLDGYLQLRLVHAGLTALCALVGLAGLSRLGRWSFATPLGASFALLTPLTTLVSYENTPVYLAMAGFGLVCLGADAVSARVRAAWFVLAGTALALGMALNLTVLPAVLATLVLARLAVGERRGFLIAPGVFLLLTAAFAVWYLSRLGLDDFLTPPKDHRPGWDSVRQVLAYTLEWPLAVFAAVLAFRSAGWMARSRGAPVTAPKRRAPYAASVTGNAPAHPDREPDGPGMHGSSSRAFGPGFPDMAGDPSVAGDPRARDEGGRRGRGGQETSVWPLIVGVAVLIAAFGLVVLHQTGILVAPKVVRAIRFLPGILGMSWTSGLRYLTALQCNLLMAFAVASAVFVAAPARDETGRRSLACVLAVVGFWLNQEILSQAYVSLKIFFAGPLLGLAFWRLARLPGLTRTGRWAVLATALAGLSVCAVVAGTYVHPGETTLFGDKTVLDLPRLKGLRESPERAETLRGLVRAYDEHGCAGKTLISLKLTSLLGYLFDKPFPRGLSYIWPAFAYPEEEILAALQSGPGYCAFVSQNIVFANDRERLGPLMNILAGTSAAVRPLGHEPPRHVYDDFILYVGP